MTDLPPPTHNTLTLDDRRVIYVITSSQDITIMSKWCVTHFLKITIYKIPYTVLVIYNTG